MKVSKKSLELNVGADFFAELAPGTRIFAFQFKAPKGPQEGEPYRFTIQRRQHQKLFALAGGSMENVFYVLPYNVGPVKLQSDVPNLLSDTSFLPVGSMRGTDPFGTYKTRTVRCQQGQACINPEYELQRVEELKPGDGIPVEQFAVWYEDLHGESDQPYAGAHREIDVRKSRVLRKDP